MSPVSKTPVPTGPSTPIEVSESSLREVIETLAPIERGPCSPGERRAAEWIRERFERAGCDEVTLEEETSWGTWPPNLTVLAVISTLGSLLVLMKRRVKGALLSALALAGLIDEIQNGPRIYRRLIRRPKTTANVVGSIGDRAAARTVVVIAHHDAAQTGHIFDQTWAKTVHRIRPEQTEKSKFQIPQWWLGVGGAVLAIVSALLHWKRPGRWAFGMGVVSTAAVVDIARSETVPGANDNLSGVAVLVGLAEALKARPIDGLRVLLVSCGAEETFQDGIRAFMERHRSELEPGSTSFLSYDTVGAGNLLLLEGEGPVWMEDYADPAFRDLVSQSAEARGIELERGVRVRASTDAIIPSRAGHPTASFISFMPWRMPANYHLMSDVPEKVDYGLVADCVRVGYGVLEDLA